MLFSKDGRHCASSWLDIHLYIYLLCTYPNILPTMIKNIFKIFFSRPAHGMGIDRIYVGLGPFLYSLDLEPNLTETMNMASHLDPTETRRPEPRLRPESRPSELKKKKSNFHVIYLIY